MTKKTFKMVEESDWGVLTYILKRAHKFKNATDIIYSYRRPWKPYKNSFKVDPRSPNVWMAITKAGFTGFGNSRLEAVTMAQGRTLNAEYRKRQKV